MFVAGTTTTYKTELYRNGSLGGWKFVGVRDPYLNLWFSLNYLQTWIQISDQLQNCIAVDIFC